MRKIKLMVSIAMSAVLLLTNCVKNEESEGVKALRMAQAGLYNAKAAAETMIAEAEAAYRNGLAAIQAANARAIEIANDFTEAKNEADKLTYLAKAEAELIAAQNAIEVAKIKAQQDLAEANKNLTTSLAEYKRAIYDAQNQDAIDLWATYATAIKEVRDLRTKITALTTEISTDELKLANWNLKEKTDPAGANELFREETLKDIARLQKDSTDEKEILDELNGDLTALKAVISGSTDYEAMKETVENEIRTMKSVIVDLEKQEADSVLAIDNYKQSDKYKSDIETYEMAFDSIYGVVSYEKMEYVPGFTDFDLTNGDYSPAQRIEDIEDLIIDANKDIKSLMDDNDALEKSNDELKNANDALEAQLTVYQNDYIAKSTAYNNAKSIYETALVARDEAKANFDVDNSTANQTALTTAENELSTAKNNMDDAKIDLDTAKDYVDNTRTAIDTNTDTIDDNEATIAENKTYITLHENGIKVMTEEITEIETAIAYAKSKLDDYHAAYMAAMKELSNKMDNKQVISDEIIKNNALLANKETLLQSINTSNYEALKTAAENLETSIKNQEDAIDEIVADIAVLQKSLANDQALKDDLAKKIQDKKSELAEKQEELTKREAQANEIESELQAVLDELATL